MRTEVIIRPENLNDIVIDTIEDSFKKNNYWIPYPTIKFNESSSIENQYTQNDPLISASFMKSKGSLKTINFRIYCIAEDKNILLSKIRYIFNIFTTTRGLFLYKPENANTYTYYYYLQSKEATPTDDSMYDFVSDSANRMFARFDVELTVLPVATSDPNILYDSITSVPNDNTYNNTENILIPKNLNSGDKDTSLKLTVTNRGANNITQLYINTTTTDSKIRYDLNSIVQANIGTDNGLDSVSTFREVVLEDIHKYKGTYVAMLHCYFYKINSTSKNEFFKYRLYIKLTDQKIYITEWQYTSTSGTDVLEYVGQFKLLPFDINYNLDITSVTLGMEISQDFIETNMTGSILYLRKLILLKMDDNLIQINTNIPYNHKLELFRNNYGINCFVLDPTNKITGRPTSIFGSNGLFINSFIDNYMNVIAFTNSSSGYTEITPFGVDVKLLFRTIYPLSTI